jgi:DNA-directed RNA polymerase subunit M/transcription elongation factor TFIIS
MHFCPICNNMYYHQVEDNSLKFSCKNCGNVQDNLTNFTISKIQIKKNNKQFNNTIINPYTKYDPSLDRRTDILCPNESCESNTNKSKREVVYIRYDDINMKYAFTCCVCDTIWNSIPNV